MLYYKLVKLDEMKSSLDYFSRDKRVYKYFFLSREEKRYEEERKGGEMFDWLPLRGILLVMAELERECGYLLVQSIAAQSDAAVPQMVEDDPTDVVIDAELPPPDGGEEVAHAFETAYWQTQQLQAA